MKANAVMLMSLRTCAVDAN